ncbi:hypothetical protein QOT17_010525 [Balamuthia mandrillaris]
MMVVRSRIGCYQYLGVLALNLVVLFWLVPLLYRPPTCSDVPAARFIYVPSSPSPSPPPQPLNQRHEEEQQQQQLQEPTSGPCPPPPVPLPCIQRTEGEEEERRKEQEQEETMGVIYVMTRETRMADEALMSAKSIRALYPSMAITFFADATILRYLETIKSREGPQPYDQVISVTDWNLPTHSRDRFPKLHSFIKTPYDKTLFMDVDTYFCGGDLLELFSWLDRFDLLLTAAPAQHINNHRRPGVPYDFLELNSGVVLLRRSPAMERMVLEWERLMVEKPAGDDRDQPALREALWFADRSLSFYILPESWNCRHVTTCPKKSSCHVVHAHGAGAAMAEWENKLGKKWTPPKTLYKPAA